ncbi:MAG TPA: patatin-like phospholipase family protein [Rhizomicrobium sp.]|jgi:patatin-like phospholipase/acyl hydrolase|nr:patatin-like phospholipase family protein [Rhizomicrobium sp.]
MPQIDPVSAPGQEIKILSIDGGGIRGIFPARILQEIEQRTSKPIAALFHLVAGTSTGGIIACGLANNMKAEALLNLYVQDGGEIFSRSFWQRITNLGGLNGPKYSADNLEKVLLPLLQDVALKDVTSTELLIPTYAIELSKPIDSDGVQSTRMPMFFKSWKARGQGLNQGQQADDYNFRLRDIARATSAAPTYFPPAQVYNSSGDAFGAVDGGVFANNPSLCALAAAYQMYPGAKFTLVSLGTGSLERPVPYAHARGWGTLQWLHPILSVLMDGNADTVTYQCDQVLGARHFRFETTLGTDPSSPIAVNEDFDDASPDNIARLERLAAAFISANDKKIDQVCALL